MVMNIKLRIGIIGDFDQARLSHTATDEALYHAANASSLSLDVAWLPTQELENDSTNIRLKSYHALWCSPGGAYKSTLGAMKAIKFSRENDMPFMGT